MVSDTKDTSARKLKNPAALQLCFHPVTGCHILILFFFFSLYFDIQLNSVPVSETDKISGKEVKHLLGGVTNSALLAHWGRRTYSSVQNEIFIFAEGVCLLQTPQSSDSYKKAPQIIHSLFMDALMVDIW